MRYDDAKRKKNVFNLRILKKLLKFKNVFLRKN